MVAASILALILLVPVAPVHAAAPAGSTPIIFHPPYAGATPQTGRNVGQQGCQSRGAIPGAPTANASTGRVGARLYAWSRACPLGPAYAYSGVNVGFSGPEFNVTTPGVRNVTFTWNVSWSAALDVRLANNLTFADAAASVELVDFVYDETNSSDVGYADSFFWSGFSANGSVRASEINVTQLAFTDVDLTPANQYEAQSNLYVYVSTYTSPGCSALATFGLAFGGGATRLVEVSVA